MSKKGFGSLELVVAILIVAVVAGAGYWYWRDSEDVDDGWSDDRVAMAPVPDCNRKLFDSHMHNDEPEFAEDSALVMEEYGVGCGVIFMQMDLTDMDEDLLLIRESLENVPGRFIPFMDIVEDTSTVVTRDQLDRLYGEFGGYFKGFGEFAFYRPEFAGMSLLAEPWPTIFTFAAEHDLIIMLHITPAQEQDLKTMLTRYPETKVIVHGFELGNRYGDLLKQHLNLYYTLDTATLLIQGMDNLMYPADFDNGLTNFIQSFELVKEQLLDQATNTWRPVLDAASDRVFWGTDVSMDWHLDPRVYPLLIEFTQDFMATLPMDVRDKYAYQNAYRLLGNGVAVEPLTETDLDRLGL